MTEALFRLEQGQSAMYKEMTGFQEAQHSRMCDVETILHGDEKKGVCGMCEKLRNTDLAVQKMEKRWVAVIGIVAFVFTMLADVFKAWAVTVIKALSIKVG